MVSESLKNSEDSFMNDRERLIYEGLMELVLSKNDKFLLNKKILKAKSTSLLEKLKTVRTEKIKQLFKDLEELPKFPDDFEMQKFVRLNTEKYCLSFEQKRIERKEPLTYLDGLAEKYPAFYDVIQAIKLRPDDYMPDEIQRKILRMLADPRNFKSDHIVTPNKKVHK